LIVLTLYEHLALPLIIAFNLPLIICLRKGDKLSISVIDNGGGIPKEIREKLFMPFVSGKKGGTGLGLALVKKIIEDHDGDIVLGGGKIEI
jgi:signal transduction histidine kinase